MWLKLGGMDTLYSPFYWEDIDLSYRAWKSGYQILYDPNIIVEHHHESTIAKYFDKKKVSDIQSKIESTEEGLIVIYGCGAAIICKKPD